MRDKPVDKEKPDRACGEAGAAIRAIDALLTLAVYEVRPGWGCRAKPKWEQRRRCPQPRRCSLPGLCGCTSGPLRLPWRIMLRKQRPEKPSKSMLWRMVRFQGGDRRDVSHVIVGSYP